MNRWVLLEHKVYLENLVDIHYDFLLEDQKDCLTWKFLKIPSAKEDFVEIVKQPNHRLVWLFRVDFVLSNNRGLVKRIDHGTFIKVSPNSTDYDLKVKLDGAILNGVFEISGNICRLIPNK